uniref:Pentacotripeptide-repeat region of PRORP domain-containing protein n=1 Tax=Leersia perrieri TaxID=77586 RepID=A0A0D9XIU9_9ORYZ
MLRRSRHFLPPKPHRRRRLPKPRAAGETKTSPPIYTRDVVHRVNSILRSHPWSEARPLLLSVPGLSWDSHTVARVLKTHPPLHKAFLFFRLAPIAAGAGADGGGGFRHDRFTYTSMIHLLGEAGRMEAMLRLLAEMLRAGVDPDAATFTTVMHWMARSGDVDGAMRVWEEMRAGRGGRRRGCRPTLVSYTACVKILFDAGRAEEARRVFEEMLAEGLRPSCKTYTVLIEHLANVGEVFDQMPDDWKFEAAMEIMGEMQEAGVEPDKALCNILVQKCSRAGETLVMTRILQYMKENFIVLRRPIFLEALEAIKDSGESDNLLREVNPHLAFEGIECDAAFMDIGYITVRSIILYLLAARNWSAIEQMIKEMTPKNIKVESHILSDIVQASCANCRPSCGLAVLRYSLRIGNELERSAYGSLLGHYIRNGSYDTVFGIVEILINSGCNLGTYLASTLIMKLASAGHSSLAVRIFGLLTTDQNVVTYTALMCAYFQAGKADKALQLFSQMNNSGISACSGTYQVLIHGLQMAGRKQDSEHYQRERMEMQWHLQYHNERSPEDSLCNHLFCRFHG